MEQKNYTSFEVSCLLLKKEIILNRQASYLKTGHFIKSWSYLDQLFFKLIPAYNNDILINHLIDKYNIFVSIECTWNQLTLQPRYSARIVFLKQQSFIKVFNWFDSYQDALNNGFFRALSYIK